jgi:K+-transporting ATPase ATPase B chain
MTKHPRSSTMNSALLWAATGNAFRKLDPRAMARNPVMFVVEITATLTTFLFLRDLVHGQAHLGFAFQINLWLWFTVLFANFAEAVAEGRGKAQAETLRRTRSDTVAKVLADQVAKIYSKKPAQLLERGDLVLVEPGDIIPSDGEIVEGVASVDESAITGESAPVIRESGGDRSAVTGGTRVLSDHIVVRITATRGSTFLDRMIALVEGAERQKTPNEIALNILLAGLTIIFVFAVATIPAYAAYANGALTVLVLVALFVTLIPTTIGALLSAIGIAGMDRLVRFNVLAMSGRAVEAAGDVDTLLLDKTGTITLGNRHATQFLPLDGVGEQELAEAAFLASQADETPEGRSIVALAQSKYGASDGQIKGTFVPFTAQTRLSGIDSLNGSIRKGAVDAVLNWSGLSLSGAALTTIADRIAKTGGTPLAVAKDKRLLGVIHLKDIVKGGIRERFSALRQMGIRTVMITGDNPLTAAAIAAEAGVDDFLAQATPENKLALIREEQAKGKLVAMCGDGTNDAPAGPGRCRRGDEYRHHGGARSWQHGGPGLRSHQADRDRGDRQTAPDDPRRVDDLFHRQRRGQIFRHHPGHVPGFLSAASGAEHHGAAFAAKRHPVGHHLQCPDHRGADPAGAERREIPPRRCGHDLAPQSADLWPGRYRRAVRRHQGHRSDRHRHRPGLRRSLCNTSVPPS